MSSPDESLASARDKAKEGREQADLGIDSIETRKAKPEEVTTFTTCAATYIRAHRRGRKYAKHARQWARTLKTWARPVLGSKRVIVIGTEDILKFSHPFGLRKP